MPYLHSPRFVRTALETTYGTAVALTTGDLLLCRKLDAKPLEGQWKERMLEGTPFPGAQSEDIDNPMIRLMLEWEAAGSGTAGLAPAWADALLACGFAQTLTAGVSAAYTPVQSAYPSITAEYRIDTLAQQAVGCRGSMKFTANAGDYPYFSGDFLGKYAAPTQPAALAFTAANMAAFKKPVTLNPLTVPTFTWNGYKLCFTQFEVSDGRKVLASPYANCDAVGLDDPAFKGSMTIRMEDVGAKNLIEESRLGTLQALSFVMGTVAGNRITVSAPAVQMKFVDYVKIPNNDLGAKIDINFTRPDAAAPITFTLT